MSPPAPGPGASGVVKWDEAKPRMSLLPPDALMAVARAMEFGAARYGDHNWAAGTRWTRYVDAAMRHQLAWLSGEDNDPESGLPHLAHAVCGLLFSLAYTLRGAGEDDRGRR